MGVGAGLYMYDVVVKSSRSLSHLLMSFLFESPEFVTKFQPEELMFLEIPEFPYNTV